MDARKVVLGASLLAASGAILMATGASEGWLLLGLAVLGLPGIVVGEVREAATDRN